MTIKDFIKYFEGKYPLKLQEEWDNSGLLFGNPKKVVNNIVVSLDLTTNVMNEAIKNKADLIVTHHPFIFGNDLETKFADAPYKKSIYKRLQNTGIALYASHTNFDVANNGMSDAFVSLLGFKAKKIPGASFGKMFDAQLNDGQLKKILNEKIGMTSFLTNIPEEGVQTTRVAVFPGSGGMRDILAAHKAGAGIIVTADVKWNMWVTIKEMGINVIQVTHAMEDVFTHKVSEDLKAKFKDANILPIYTEEIAK